MCVGILPVYQVPAVPVKLEKGIKFSGTRDAKGHWLPAREALGTRLWETTKSSYC